MPFQSYPIALSYVWGKVPMLQTTKANLAELQEDGALTLFGDQIPRVVKEAMEVVAGLGGLVTFKRRFICNETSMVRAVRHSITCRCVIPCPLKRSWHGLQNVPILGWKQRHASSGTF